MQAITPTLQELGDTIFVAGFPSGEYDVLIVYEAPDDVTAASVAMAVAAAGEVKSAKTTRLLSGHEWLESLRKRKIVTTRKARRPDDHQRQSPEPRYNGGRSAGAIRQSLLTHPSEPPAHPLMPPIGRSPEPPVAKETGRDDSFGSPRDRPAQPPGDVVMSRIVTASLGAGAPDLPD